MLNGPPCINKVLLTYLLTYLLMGCSGVLWDVPGVFRDCSGLFRGVPGCSGGVPGVFRGVPGVFRGVPGCSGCIPGFTDTHLAVILDESHQKPFYFAEIRIRCNFFSPSLRRKPLLPFCAIGSKKASFFPFQIEPFVSYFGAHLTFLSSL